MSAFGNQIKQWLLTGLKPTQEQFASWVDKTRLKDEPIQFADMTQQFIELINGLGSPIEIYEGSGTWQYIIPAGYVVEYFIIKPPADFNLQWYLDGEMVDSDVLVEAAHGLSLEGLKLAFVDKEIVLFNLPSKTVIYVKRFKLPV